MLICRYDKDANPNSCGGCQYGCIERKPATINKEFEEAIKGMEDCSNKNIKLKMITVGYTYVLLVESSCVQMKKNALNVVKCLIGKIEKERVWSTFYLG